MAKAKTITVSKAWTILQMSILLISVGIGVGSVRMTVTNQTNKIDRLSLQIDTKVSKDVNEQAIKRIDEKLDLIIRILDDKQNKYAMYGDDIR